MSAKSAPKRISLSVIDIYGVTMTSVDMRALSAIIYLLRPFYQTLIKTLSLMVNRRSNSSFVLLHKDLSTGICIYLYMKILPFVDYVVLLFVQTLTSPGCEMNLL